MKEEQAPVIPGPETIDKLNQLISFLEKEPRRFNMATYGIFGGSADDLRIELNRQVNEGLDTYRQDNLPPCNTVGCLAGNAMIVSGKVIPETIKDKITGRTVKMYTFGPEVIGDAARWLGIDDVSAERLFFLKRFGKTTNFWPEVFEERLNQFKPGTAEYMAVTRDRILHFAATGE